MMKEDLEALRKAMADLRAKLDNLEGRVASLEQRASP
jgi:BMFP domain-containing protein YqiC